MNRARKSYSKSQVYTNYTYHLAHT